MNRKILIALLLLIAIKSNAQKAIPLYPGTVPGSESWTYDERKTADGSLVYNVSKPTITAYLPDPAIATGTAVVVCPGGGFYILAIENEGELVAKWLNKKGIAAFVLKYRTAQSLTDNPGKELGDNLKKPDFPEMVKSIIPLCIADGREAIKYVRTHAAEYKISPSRVGIIGFSAGGTVAASSAYGYTLDNRPDFVAAIYAYMPPSLQGKIAVDAPSMFLAAASDDNLGLVPHSIDLYSKWLASKHPVELHLYEQGKHGFGMRKQNIPTDTWIERFSDWLGLEGLLKPIDPKVAAKNEQQVKNDKYSDYLLRKDWSNIKRYESQNAKIASASSEKRVVFMGNSITDSWINVDSTFFAGKPYFDRGISGQTTGQMLVRFREDVINLKPAVVVIMAGINDIAENNGPSKVEDVFGNIRSMAEIAKASNIKVVLSSVMPAYGFPWRPAIDPKPSIKALNEMIKDYCAKNNVVYLDYFTALADDRKSMPAKLSKDGVHPNLAGYKIMEPLAEKAIDEAMGKK